MSDPYEDFREASAVGQPCFCEQEPCICYELIDQAEEWEADDEANDNGMEQLPAFSSQRKKWPSLCHLPHRN